MAVESTDASGSSSESDKAALVVGILLILAQGILAIALSFYILGRAYAFAGSSAVGSIDELHRLGDGPKLAVASTWLMPLFGTLTGIFLLISPLYRWAWLAPVIAMLTSVALCLYFISTFEYTPPTGG